MHEENGKLLRFEKCESFSETRFLFSYFSFLSRAALLAVGSMVFVKGEWLIVVRWVERSRHHYRV